MESLEGKSPSNNPRLSLHRPDIDQEATDPESVDDMWEYMKQTVDGSQAFWTIDSTALAASISDMIVDTLGLRELLVLGSPRSSRSIQSTSMDANDAPDTAAVHSIDIRSSSPTSDAGAQPHSDADRNVTPPPKVKAKRRKTKEGDAMAHDSNTPIERKMRRASTKKKHLDIDKLTPAEQGFPTNFGSTNVHRSTMDPAEPHTWSPCDGANFNVRTGPAYQKNKLKAPSAPALYEMFAMDIVRTKKRLSNAGQNINLPDVSHVHTHSDHVKPIFILNLQLSSESPSLFFNEDDGPGYSLVFYFMITEDTCKQLKHIEQASPGVKLFSSFCEKAPTDLATRARFKVICRGENLEAITSSSFISSYNGKPILISGPKSGSAMVDHSRGYFEIDIHTHCFPLIAKQSIHYLLSKTHDMYMSFGFVIEGVTDDELPEVIVGCAGVNKPHNEGAVYLPHEMN